MVLLVAMAPASETCGVTSKSLVTVVTAGIQADVCVPSLSKIKRIEYDNYSHNSTKRVKYM